MNEIINLNHFTNLAEIDKTYPDWRYLGRSGTKLELLPDGTRVPTPLTGSPLANPFKMTSGANRERVIQQYRHWLWQQITRRNPAVLAALAQIGPETALACWCTPRHCHCHIAARAAAWLRKQDAAASPTAERCAEDGAEPPYPASRARPPLPTRYAPGQKVGDTNDYCTHHTHAKCSLFVKGKQVFYAHRLDSGTWCAQLAAEDRVTPPGISVVQHVKKAVSSGIPTPCPMHSEQLLSVCSEGSYVYPAHQLPDGTWCRPA